MVRLGNVGEYCFDIIGEYCWKLSWMRNFRDVFGVGAVAFAPQDAMIELQYNARVCSTLSCDQFGGVELYD